MSRDKQIAGIGVISILLTVIALLGTFILFNQGKATDNSELQLEGARVTNSETVIRNPLTELLPHRGTVSDIKDITIGFYCLETSEESPMRFGLTFSGMPIADGPMVSAIKHGSKRMQLPEYQAVAGQPFVINLELAGTKPSSYGLKAVDTQLSIAIGGVEEAITFDVICRPQ